LFPSKIIRQSPGICATRESPQATAHTDPPDALQSGYGCASFTTTKYAECQTVIPVLNRNTTPRPPP
jgi:hypothetical protein